MTLRTPSPAGRGEAKVLLGRAPSSLRGAWRRSNPGLCSLKAGLLRGACHRAGHFGPDPLARNDESNPLLATRSAPEFCESRRHNDKALFDSPPADKGRRSAERRKFIGAAPHRHTLPFADAPQTSGRSLRHLSAYAAAGISEPARLPALRGGSCRSDRTLRLSPGRASRDEVRRRYLRLCIALKRGTPRAGRSTGGNDARTARGRGYKPRPQEPHSPIQRLSPVDVPEVGEIRILCSANGDACQDHVTATVSVSAKMFVLCSFCQKSQSVSVTF